MSAPSRPSVLLVIFAGFVAVPVLGQPIPCDAPDPAGPLASLVAVAINGQPIPRTNCVNANRGDVIETEIRLSGWGMFFNELRGYQVLTSGLAGASSGDFGLVLPLGWDAPVDSPVRCLFEAGPDDNLCLFEPGLHCSATIGTCVRQNHHPELGVAVDTSRADYVLSGLSALGAIGTHGLDYIYFAVAVERTGRADDGRDYYAGTLRLHVMDDACGAFFISFLEPRPDYANPNEFIDPTNTFAAYPAARGLQISVPRCDCNNNGRSDLEEIAGGDSLDSNQNEIPDQCEAPIRTKLLRR